MSQDLEPGMNMQNSIEIITKQKLNVLHLNSIQDNVNF